MLAKRRTAGSCTKRTEVQESSNKTSWTKRSVEGWANFEATAALPSALADRNHFTQNRRTNTGKPLKGHVKTSSTGCPSFVQGSTRVFWEFTRHLGGCRRSPPFQTAGASPRRPQMKGNPNDANGWTITTTTTTTTTATNHHHHRRHHHHHHHHHNHNHYNHATTATTTTITTITTTAATATAAIRACRTCTLTHLNRDIPQCIQEGLQQSSAN